MVHPISVAETYACPKCHRVVPFLFLIEWTIGLDLFGPSKRCLRCVEELEAETRVNRYGSSVMDLCWSIDVLEVSGSTGHIEVAAA